MFIIQMDWGLHLTDPNRYPDDPRPPSPPSNFFFFFNLTATLPNIQINSNSLAVSQRSLYIPSAYSSKVRSQMVRLPENPEQSYARSKHRLNFYFELLYALHSNKNINKRASGKVQRYLPAAQQAGKIIIEFVGCRRVKRRPQTKCQSKFKLKILPIIKK